MQGQYGWERSLRRLQHAASSGSADCITVEQWTRHKAAARAHFSRRSDFSACTAPHGTIAPTLTMAMHEVTNTRQVSKPVTAELPCQSAKVFLLSFERLEHPAQLEIPVRFRQQRVVWQGHYIRDLGERVNAPWIVAVRGLAMHPH